MRLATVFGPLRRFNLAHPWVDGFQTGFLCPVKKGRIVVAAVGMWQSRRLWVISKGGWEGWKTWVWFSMLSTVRHFHRFTGSSLLSSAVPECGGIDTTPNRFPRMCARSVMRSSNALHKRAFGMTCVPSENGRFVVKTTAVRSGRFGDHLEQELATHLCQRHVPDFVDCNHIVAAPTGEHAPELHLLSGFDQLVNKRCGGEAHAQFLPARETETVAIWKRNVWAVGSGGDCASEAIAREPAEQRVAGAVSERSKNRSARRIRSEGAAANSTHTGAGLSVWAWASDADLSGSGSDGHAQGLRRAVRLGA